MKNNTRPLVAHIITRLEPGGSARNTIDSAAYQSKDMEVALLAGPFLGGLAAPEGVHCLELPGLKREISPLSDLKTFLELKRIFSRLEPALIHTHTSKAGFLGRLAAEWYNRSANKRKALVIHTPHGHLLYGYYGPLKTLLFKFAERLAARWTDRFIALTRGELEESAAAGFGAREKWSVIHSGVRFTPRDIDRQAVRKELGLAADAAVMGLIARFEPVKGVEYFIKAAKILADKAENDKLRFLLVGGGKLETDLRRLAQNLGIYEKMIFTGFQSDIYRYLYVMDLYVQPSLNEAMGRTVLEAQYCRLPVIVSKVCGLPDIVRDGITGLLVAPADPAAIAAAAQTLLSNDAKKRAMGEAARRWVLQKDHTGYPQFSAEAMNISLKNFYNKVLTSAA